MPTIRKPTVTCSYSCLPKRAIQHPAVASLPTPPPCHPPPMPHARIRVQSSHVSCGLRLRARTNPTPAALQQTVPAKAAGGLFFMFLSCDCSLGLCPFALARCICFCFSRRVCELFWRSHQVQDLLQTLPFSGPKTFKHCFSGAPCLPFYAPAAALSAQTGSPGPHAAAPAAPRGGAQTGGRGLRPALAALT